MKFEKDKNKCILLNGSTKNDGFNLYSNVFSLNDIDTSNAEPFSNEFYHNPNNSIFNDKYTHCSNGNALKQQVNSNLTHNTDNQNQQQHPHHQVNKNPDPKVSTPQLDFYQPRFGKQQSEMEQQQHQHSNNLKQQSDGTDSDEKIKLTPSILTTENDMKTDFHKPKETWSRHLEFMLSCIGYAVGFGAFWRFPYLCMRNGGGAFLIPYFLCLIICGMPLFFLEMVIGQYTGLGAISVWNMCPLFKGVGWAMLIMSGIVTIYSNMILGWVLYFLGHSFTSPLPWATCNNTWNTELCMERNVNSNASSIIGAFDNITQSSANLTNSIIIPRGVTPAEEFWHHNVLVISPGIEHIGGFRWPLLLCLFAAWVLVYLCLFKGIKWSGKVVYVTATVPYIFLTILLIRGCMLPGALDGIIYYLKPDFQQLANPKVWAEACLQIFYSLGPTWGGLIAMSRYNKFNNNCLKDSVVICLVCCGTSFYSGFICFSIIGFMANNIGTTVADVITTGPGLVFSVYPEAIAQLPISPLWSILFFIMLLTLGLDSLFGMIESCTSGFVDEFPKFLKPRRSRLTLIVCVVFFIMGIPLSTGAGMYIFQVLDWYAAAFTAMIIALMECIVLGYIYGVDKLYDHMTEMLGRRPSLWWKICWCYLTPLSMLTLLIYSCVQMKPPVYGSYVYPMWSIIFGWIVAMCSIAPIPTYAIYRLIMEKGTVMERVKHLIRPQITILRSQDNLEIEIMNHF